MTRDGLQPADRPRRATRRLDGRLHLDADVAVAKQAGLELENTLEPLGTLLERRAGPHLDLPFPELERPGVLHPDGSPGVRGPEILLRAHGLGSRHGGQERHEPT